MSALGRWASPWGRGMPLRLVVSPEVNILPPLTLEEREGDMAMTSHRRPRECNTLT